MRFIFSVFLLVIVSEVSAQSEFQHWYSAECSGDIIKRLDWSFELNSRFDNYGMRSFFPQAGIEYKINDLLKAGIDYRFISERNNVNNYEISNRININLNAKKKLAKRLYGSIRMRYQFGFKDVSSFGYDPDFDPAIRIKPKLEYDIKNFPFSPVIGTEFFFNPNRNSYESGLSKIRTEIGVQYEGFKKQELGIKYLFERRFTDQTFLWRHIISVSYSYKL